MSISHESASTIVCKEVFDETSEPSEEDVLNHAKRLGIDPDTEPYLLHLAREGLMAALPKGWAPVYDPNTKKHYYYEISTKKSYWEHPLDAVYKDLVAQARASNRRRASVDEDSNSDDNDDDERDRRPKVPSALTGLPPPVPLQMKSPSTRIPMKLAPLKRHCSESSSTLPRRPASSLDRLTRGWKSGDNEPSSARSSLSSDRSSRDYTNLRFQNPEFYESPKLLDFGKQKLDLRDVLKRSESLSPRHESDWKQLSNRFNSDEKIIDIDKLSTTSLSGTRARTPDSQLDTPVSETNFIPQQAKELTLSGGGSVFLKSNRSRDVTPCREESKSFEVAGPSGLNTSRVAAASLDDMSASAGERLKSILREKAAEDDDRHVDEERKSVRFDLERVDIKTAVTSFNESGSDYEEGDEEDSDPEQRVAGTSSGFASKLQQALNNTHGGYSFKTCNVTPVRKVEVEAKKIEVVRSRFVVKNVSEMEHKQQQEERSIDNDYEDYVPKKFENVKNIDLVSKSDSEKTTPRSSVDLDDAKKKKDVLLENMRKFELRTKKNDDKNSISDSSVVNLETMKNNLLEEHERELEEFKEELNAKLEEMKQRLEEEFNEQRLSLEGSLQDRVKELRKEMATKEEEEVQKLIAHMDETRAENLKKVKDELEVCYEKERQDILSNLKSELDQRKRQLLELRSHELSKLENEHEKKLDDERAKLSELEVIKQHNERTDCLKKELDREFDNLKAELRAQQREKITKITEEHEKCLADILRDFRVDEGLARKVYKQRLDEIRADYSKDVENEIKKQNESIARQDSVEFEKIRCEKRLLEDKYNTLKEKYLKLKKDMRLAIERRNRRKEQANTTASETEMSTSTRTRTDRTESTDQKSPLTKTNSISNSKPKEIPSQNPSALKQQQQQQQQQSADNIQQQLANANVTTSANQAVAFKAQSKFESDDTTTCSETTSNLLMMSKQKKKVFTKKPSSGSNKLNNNLADNPVENIRKQLEKLEDLGDQLPSNETAYTVRYPFQDKSPTNVSSELEFFRHRIHVERDSVKRAREALRQQRSAFQSRQRAWKQRSARATLEQLVKEERELSDMEVSLHRTRSLLGEKVIHLRHLEQSLERVANATVKRNENDSSLGMGAATITATSLAAAAAATAKSDEVTLSDMSSASSGFSSTDLGTDTFIESTEIIASLENLNSEIREIWGVLNKRQGSSMPPPPTLMFTDLSWFPYQHLTPQPSTVPAAFGTPNIQSNILSQLTGTHPPSSTQNIIAQYGPSSGYTTSVGNMENATSSNLIERTRNLKDWLRQARVETSDLVSPGQATL